MKTTIFSLTILFFFIMGTSTAQKNIKDIPKDNNNITLGRANAEIGMLYGVNASDIYANATTSISASKGDKMVYYNSPGKLHFKLRGFYHGKMNLMITKELQSKNSNLAKKRAVVMR